MRSFPRSTIGVYALIAVVLIVMGTLVGIYKPKSFPRIMEVHSDKVGPPLYNISEAPKIDALMGLSKTAKETKKLEEKTALDLGKELNIGSSGFVTSEQYRNFLLEFSRDEEVVKAFRKLKDGGVVIILTIGKSMYLDDDGDMRVPVNFSMNQIREYLGTP